MSILEDLTKWRQDLHQIPEIGFQEFETTDYLIKELEKMGYQPQKLLDTGVLVYINNKQKETLAFRSDIDALKLKEKNNCAFISKKEGYMHGCGHDGHMATLLALAKKLTIERDYPYNYLLIFQPGEEMSGGARRVIESGCFAKYNVKAIFGMHLMPDYPFGKICVKKGAMMAQSGELDVHITGVSAHAGKYDEGVDAINYASLLVLKTREIVKKYNTKECPTIINIGLIRGGTVRNIVADNAVLQGTIRTFDEDIFNNMVNDIKDYQSKLTNSVDNLQIDVHVKSGNPPVLNNDALTEKFITCINQDDYLPVTQPLMLAEDYSHYQKVLPGVFFFTGTKDENYSSGLHTSTFNFNEEVLVHAVDAFYDVATKIKLGE